MSKKRSHGEGALYRDKSNDRWIAQITQPNGKRRTKTHKEKSVVLDWLTDQRSKIRKGTYVADEKIKFGDFLDSYMRDVASHRLRPRTFESHSGYINNHIKPALGHIRLSALRPEHLQAFYTKKLDALCA